MHECSTMTNHPYGLHRGRCNPYMVWSEATLKRTHSHTPLTRKPHQERQINIHLVKALRNRRGKKRHKRWASSFQRMRSTPWPVRVFPLRSVSNYCGTLGIWIHLQWIPLQLLPDIWDQSGLRRWCACCGNVDSLTDAGFWCHGISESLWLELGRRMRRGRREIEAEIEEGEGRGRDRDRRERRREAGDFSWLPPFLQTFYRLQGERGGGERGEKRREREG